MTFRARRLLTREDRPASQPIPIIAHGEIDMGAERGTERRPRRRRRDGVLTAGHHATHAEHDAEQSDQARGLEATPSLSAFIHGSHFAAVQRTALISSVWHSGPACTHPVIRFHLVQQRWTWLDPTPWHFPPDANPRTDVPNAHAGSTLAFGGARLCRAGPTAAGGAGSEHLRCSRCQETLTSFASLRSKCGLDGVSPHLGTARFPNAPRSLFSPHVRPNSHALPGHDHDCLRRR